MIRRSMHSQLTLKLFHLLLVITFSTNIYSQNVEENGGFWWIEPESIEGKVDLKNWGLQGKIKTIYVFSFFHGSSGDKLLSRGESWEEARVPIDSHSIEVFTYSFSDDGKLLKNRQVSLTNREDSTLFNEHRISFGNSVLRGYSSCDSTDFRTYSYDEKNRLIREDKGIYFREFVEYTYDKDDRLTKVESGNYGIPSLSGEEQGIIRNRTSYKYLGDTVEVYEQSAYNIGGLVKTNAYIYNSERYLNHSQEFRKLYSSIASYFYDNKNRLIHKKEEILLQKFDGASTSNMMRKVLEPDHDYFEYDNSGNLVELSRYRGIEKHRKINYRYNAQGLLTYELTYRAALENPDLWEPTFYDRNIYELDPKLNPTKITHLSGSHQFDNTVDLTLKSIQFVKYEYY